MRSLIILLISFSFIVPASAKVLFPAILGDNMVLQQQSSVNLWGTSNANTVKIITSWNNKEYIVHSNKKGEWYSQITTPKAGGPYSISFDDGDIVILNNILIGEVWICSGQSNMEMPLQGFNSQPCYNSVQTIIDAGKYSNIRLFKVAKATADTPQSDCVGSWKESSMESAANFSAAAYFFGLNLSKALNIPIGLIESDWGGTRIEAWMSVEAAQKVDKAILESNKENNKSNQVATLFNGMIMPLISYNARGFIWYQGESNKGYHKKYSENMREMVSLWRNGWEDQEMPFYYVQIAPFDYNIPMHRFKNKSSSILYPLMVEAQVKALDIIPISGIAGTTDIGSALDIHPPRKDLVGQRLALLALTKTYKQWNIDAHGPIYQSAEYKDGKAFVTFKSETTLYPVYDIPIKGFELAGEDSVFYPAKAKVDAVDYNFTRRVIVYSDKVRHPIAVRYAFDNVVDVNLTNTLGLPAFPFRTDNWDDIE